MRQRVGMCMFMAAIVTIFVTIVYPLRGSRDDKASWIWTISPPLSSNRDGFPHFCNAAMMFRDDEEISHGVLSKLITASNSTKWTARPAMRPFTPFGTEKYSEKLSNGTIEVDYTSLIDLSNALCHYGNSIASAGHTQEAQDVAMTMIRLGYQIARNKEDNIIGVIRVNLWKCGTEILQETKYIDDAKNAAISLQLNADLESIKGRNPNQLHTL